MTVRPRVMWALGIAFAAVVVSGCKPPAAPGGAPGGGPMAVPVSVAPAVQREVQDYEEFTGRLQATDSVEIRARVAGTIEKIHFREGQEVARGQLLFSLDARPYQAELARAEAQLNAARTAAELAASEQTRAQKLLAQKAISQQEADQLIASAQNNQANVRAAEAAVNAAKLNVEYSQMTSPINGRTSRANVTLGNLVGVGEPVLTTVVSQNKMYAYFDISEQSYLRYTSQMRSSATRPVVNMGLSSDTGFPYSGVVDFVDNQLNVSTGSIRLRATFDNSKRLFVPGLLARIQLASSSKTTAVLTPERAIGTDQSKRFVWVVEQNHVPQFREVKLGALINGMRVISSGLKAGEFVVVNGFQRIQPGAPVTAERLEVDANGMPLEKPASPPAQKG